MGHPLSYNRLAPKRQQLWKTSSPFNIIDLGSSCFIIRFTSFDDYFAVLAGGPWFLFNHYLIVQHWQANFRPSMDTFKFYAI
ncbi:hypothetical protein REPUB_Repub06bG0206600 [Reevesia pubescens]